MNKGDRAMNTVVTKGIRTDKLASQSQPSSAGGDLLAAIGRLGVRSHALWAACVQDRQQRNQRRP
jgi:hypothetical protein